MVKNTQGGNAPLCQPNPDLLLMTQKASEIALKQRALHSKPVTPVSVDRLEFLLDGYDPVLKQFLVEGFRCGFRVNYVGERSASASPNLKVPWSNRRLLVLNYARNVMQGELSDRFQLPPFLNFVVLHWALFLKKIHPSFE